MSAAPIVPLGGNSSKAMWGLVVLMLVIVVAFVVITKTKKTTLTATDPAGNVLWTASQKDEWFIRSNS